MGRNTSSDSRGGSSTTLLLMAFDGLITGKVNPPELTTRRLTSGGKVGNEAFTPLFCAGARMLLLARSGNAQLPVVKIFITPGSSFGDGGGSPLALKTTLSSLASNLAWILGVVGSEATLTVTAFLLAQGQSQLKIPQRCPKAPAAGFLPPR